MLPPLTKLGPRRSLLKRVIHRGSFLIEAIALTGTNLGAIDLDNVLGFL